MNGNRDIKPMSWARKSEIAERADTLEARAEAKKEAEAPADPEGASTLFRGDTASTDYALIDNMCKDFTNALRQYLSLEHATATIMQQADEATNDTSKDIPDLEGAELKL